jgi:recombinational DNA repair protein RecT
MSENPLTIFQGELESREQEIVNTLPSTIKPEVFKNAAIIAVKRDPGLLNVNRRSLHQAVTAAARDGMMPDGKEGVIIADKNGARWQPMAYGIRKRCRELDNIVIDCQVVYKNDHFLWSQGDDARLEHHPAPLDTAPGLMIGAYAIFRKGSEILHREVMRKDEIEAVRSVSKQPNGLMWSKFTSEAWKKTVLRRGIKTVVVSDKLRTILERDDEAHFDLNHQRLAPPPIPPAIPAPPIHEIEEVEQVNGRPFEESVEQEAPEEAQPEPEVEIPELSTIKALFGSARSKKSIAAMEQRMKPGIMLMDEDTRAAAVEIIQAAKGRVSA